MEIDALPLWPSKPVEFPPSRDHYEAQLISALRARLALAVQMLETHGAHRGLCNSKWPGEACDCGLTATIAACREPS